MTDNSSSTEPAGDAVVVIPPTVLLHNVLTLLEAKSFSSILNEVACASSCVSTVAWERLKAPLELHGQQIVLLVVGQPKYSQNRKMPGVKAFSLRGILLYW